MRTGRRLGIGLGLVAVVLPVTIALIIGRGLVVEIKASADTPPLLPDAADMVFPGAVPLPVAGDVLLAGGMGAGRAKFKTIAKTEYYNPLKRAFFVTGTMPVTGAALAASPVASTPGAKIVAFGGLSGMSHATINLLSFTGLVMASAETYDPSTGKWTAGSNSMSSSRAGATATLLPSGKILIAGGFNSSELALNTAEIYNPADGTFVATDNNMTNPRAFHTATLLLNGKVLLDSGLTNNTGDLSSTADIFDPNAGTHGTFTTSTSTAGSRAGAVAVLFPSGLLAGKVLITGGDVCTSTVEVCSGMTIDLYDPVKDIFTFPAVMHEFRMNHTATLLKDGTVLIAGGIDVTASLGMGTVLGNSALTTFSRSAEIFDPATVTLSCVGGPGATGGCAPTMTHTRAGHTATLLNDGTVLIAGGFASYGRPPFQMGAATTSAETYDPVAKTFKKTMPMHTARGAQTATLLQ
jgi:Galactose oxidase, central domain